jgi:NagD protein
MPPQLAKIRHVVLDMDGTIYLGHTLFECTLPMLAKLRELGVGYSFVTNNCSHSRGDYVRRLRGMGIEADRESVTTSAQAAAHYLRLHLPSVRQAYVLGTAGLVEDLLAEGYEAVDRDPQAVVVGFDTGLTYDRLCRAAYWISRGLPYVATHPDRVCPTDQATVLPDCGAICALLESATGRRPDVVCGKPAPTLIEEVMERHGLAPPEVAMVGDRLYTDVRMARDAGALAVLTLSGEARADEALALPEAGRPDLIVQDVGELAHQLAAARGR